ncbi:uncharacterized protein LOC105696356 [Orussus abietinus]|uniref:uncharacterized protein LOC105696356 n=1 Tax=Orussus abietinus TaxID=222816 RepID=UPI000625671A|nr:uncharacterized protein LOC105696356 [Orussus abietinus]
MTVPWTEKLTTKLISLYRRYECFRDPYHPDFGSGQLQLKAWKEIVDFLNIPGLTVCDCVKRISFVTKRYCYELYKISSAISSGDYYKPKALWFEMMHELLFPLTNSRDRVGDFRCRSDNCNSYTECKSETGSANSPEEFRPRRRSKSGRSPQEISRDHPGEASISGAWTQTEARTNVIRNGGDRSCAPKTCAKWTQVSKNVHTVAVGRDPNKEILRTKCRIVSIIYFTAIVVRVKDSGIYAQMDVDGAGSRKRDEFDMFGKCIAYQLRSLGFEIAIDLEKRIQDMITRERLDNAKNAESDEQICSCSCSDCKKSCKEEMCACGLPVSECQPPLSR